MLDLIQQVTVVGRKEDFMQKFKSIKQKCNTIEIPKVSVREAAYETSPQPMVPITGQSRLNVISSYSKYDSSFNFQSISPEDW